MTKNWSMVPVCALGAKSAYLFLAGAGFFALALRAFLRPPVNIVFMP